MLIPSLGKSLSLGVSFTYRSQALPKIKFLIAVSHQEKTLVVAEIQLECDYI